MLEQIDALPFAERQPPFHKRDRELNLSESGAQMRRHVVRAFVIMGIGVRILGRDPREIRLEIGADLRRGIFLNEQRGRRVPAKYRQQPIRHLLVVDPSAQLRCNLEQTLLAGSELQYRGRLSHWSAIADLARRRTRFSRRRRMSAPVTLHKLQSQTSKV